MNTLIVLIYLLTKSDTEANTHGWMDKWMDGWNNYEHFFVRTTCFPVSVYSPSSSVSGTALITAIVKVLDAHQYFRCLI